MGCAIGAHQAGMAHDAFLRDGADALRAVCKSGGVLFDVKAMLPHVDRFLPVHNLQSLADLGKALRAPAVSPSTLLH